MVFYSGIKICSYIYTLKEKAPSLSACDLKSVDWADGIIRKQVILPHQPVGG
jgi:hypothetical protein